MNGPKVALRVHSWMWPAGAPSPVQRSGLVVVPSPACWDQAALEAVIHAALRKHPAAPLSEPGEAWPSVCHVEQGRPAFPGESEGHRRIDRGVPFLRFWVAPIAYAVALPTLPIAAVEQVLADASSVASLSWAPQTVGAREEGQPCPAA
jgi:hypothetical protein